MKDYTAIKEGTIVETTDNYGSRFVVVKNDQNNEMVYGLFITDSIKNKEDIRYYKYIMKNQNKEYEKFIKCNDITEIMYSNIEQINGCVANEELGKVISKLSSIIIDKDIVSYDYLSKNIQRGCVCNINGEYFLATNVQGDKCKVYRFTSQTKEDQPSIRLNNKQFTVSKKGANISKSDIDYVVKRIDKNTMKKIEAVLDKKEYEFGDILNIQNYGKKVIYITTFNNELYCCDKNSLELFSGFERIPEKKIIDKCDELTNTEQINLLKKLKRSLDNNRYIPEDIQSDVKTLTKKL